MDFAHLHTFCNCHPPEMPLKNKRKELSQAADNFDYEAIGRVLRQIIDLLKKDRRGGT